MPSRPNAFQALAEKAAARIDEARAQGEQLSLLADQEPAAVADGRAVRGKGKAMSQMREFLSAKGYRLPEEALAQMAGLASRDDAVLTAMITAERIVTWAFAGQKDKDGNEIKASPAAMLRAFETAYSVQLRALDALMPYGLAKVGADGPQAPVVQINVPSTPTRAADPATAARDVTPRVSGRMMPANLRYQLQQNQQLADGRTAPSDGAGRTERASD